MVSLKWCGGSCIALDNLSNRTSVSSKWKSVNFKKFNTIKGISKSKLLVKHILHNYKCRFEGKKKKIIQTKNGVKIDANVKRF